MVRFYAALWGAKLFTFVNKLRNNERDDLPGLLAFKICPQFLEKVGKPELVITITGTNGKTTTATLVNNYFVSKGKKTSFNDWGANVTAGFCYNLLRGVNVFNRPKVDVSVLEADEMTLNFSMPQIKPNYIICLNLGKDTLKRNAQPEFVLSHVDDALNQLGDRTTAILNSNDPISSQAGSSSKARRIFYGMKDMGLKPFMNKAMDIRVCPKCGADIEWKYRFYRHLGAFECPNCKNETCDFKNPEADYLAEGLDLAGRTITIRHGDELETYPLISDTIFNAFNVLSVVSMLRDMGEPAEDIKNFLATQKITSIREDLVEHKGVKYYAYAAKGQNISAASVVFEYVAKEPSIKEIVLCLDEAQDKNHPLETVSWLYEADHEFLNSPNIKKIVCAGHMRYAHYLRLLLAGVPEEKLFIADTDEQIPGFIDYEGIDSVYVLHDVDVMSKAHGWRDAIVAEAKRRDGAKGEEK